MDEEKVVHNTMEYYSAIKKNEILLSTATWIDSQGIVLSGVSQTEKDRCHVISLHVESKEQIRKQRRSKLIDTESILMVAR